MTIIVVGVLIVVAGLVMSAMAAPRTKHEACNGHGCWWCDYTGSL